jgi:hypothetical protein
VRCSLSRAQCVGAKCSVRPLPGSGRKKSTTGGVVPPRRDSPPARVVQSLRDYRNDRCLLLKRVLRGAGGVGFVEGAEAAGEVAREVEEDDGVLVGQVLVEVVERGGFDFDGPDRGERVDGGGARDGVDDAHFAEDVAWMERGERDGARGVGVFDDGDGAFDEDEEGVALVAFADDPRVGSEVMHEAFAGEEGLRGEVGSGQDVDGREGVEEGGGGGDHPRRQ